MFLFLKTKHNICTNPVIDVINKFIITNYFLVFSITTKIILEFVTIILKN